MFKLRLNAVFLVICVMVFSGCSSMLYYPTSEVYVRTEALKPPPQEIRFSSEDGTELHGWLFRASTEKPAKGTIIHFHGNAQNLTAHFLFLYWIVNEGYDYFIFDYRGYGKSAGRPSPKGTVQDGRAALRWIAKNSPKDQPLIIFGQSLGGAIALRVAGELRDEIGYRGVIVDSTFHSYREAARKVLSQSALTWLFQPLAYLVLSDRWSPKEHIAKISPRPLLVIHGTRDRTVAYSLGERVFELAREPKEFWRVEGGGHTSLLAGFDRSERQRFVAAIEKIVHK